MRISSKHRNTKVIPFVDFTGGINFTKPPEALADNEAQTIINFEFDVSSGIIKTRDGLTLLLSSPNNINFLYYARNINVLFVVVGVDLYRVDTGNILTFLGSLSGTTIPVFAEWENGVLIASGGSLQFCDGSTITEISSSPLCDFVTVRFGRAVVSRQGDDNIYFSGIGDYTNWNFSGLDSDALQLEIGYKDGGRIVSVQALAKDLLVFKDNRRIYRLVGYYPDWIVYEVSRDAGAVSGSAASPVGNSIIFIDEVGARSLNTVVEYGDMKVVDIGDKINNWIRKNIVSNDVRVWHIRPRGQVWIRTQLDNFCYIFHYTINAWTIFRFNNPVTAVTHDGSDVFVAIGSNLYKLDSFANTDNGVDIEARIITSRKLPSREFLLKYCRLLYEGLASGSASVNIGRLYKNVDINLGGDVACLDSDIAYSDDDSVVAINRNEFKFRSNYRLPYIEVNLTVVSGKMKLLGVILETVEV